ncbi:formate hydrogenlyase subunit 5 [Rhodoblastus acidophilus]|uniref:hydrogenase large subunit n=1 Tax=Rhodoblastus acidophilus TaxID=1074 RepID=UPI002225037E|nr:hydrogenase large subunit [Rhodoblastus acidophilus]MCW2285407.1 formate hydrogenlyase subunit 5 [Rhodoblastus acidophilus]MCW2334344.1 formate hydrogenlyase subunit 5 [Rhodoblastus acidophilus]
MNAHTPLRIGSSYVAALRAKLPHAVLEERWQTDRQATITVKLEALPEAVRTLYYVHDGWFSTMAGNDERGLNGTYGLYYVLSMGGAEKCHMVIHAQVPEDKPEFPAVTPLVPAAVWYEREVRDMFGLEPVGLPDARRLVLPDDWPDGLYPLRKDSMDYRFRPAPTTDAENYPFINDAKQETTVVPLGPLHVTSDEPGHFRLFVDGEDIIDADYRMFYVHRGMEKLAETRMGYHDVTFLADRVCGICGYAHSVAYANSVENALGIVVPERGQAIRSILLETERLHSHLLNLGLACHFVGFDSGFMQFFRVREKTMMLAEMLTGHRKTYSMNLIGGVRRDILAEQKLTTLKTLGELRCEVRRLVDILLSTPNIGGRVTNVGRLDPKVARDHSPVGPVLRGSGFRRDTRADHPFAGYLSGATPINVQTGCDVLSRTLVRVSEVFDSMAIIENLLNDTPAGPILTEDFTYTPYKFALGFTEAPRGEDIHWSMLGDNQKLYRWRCRASTYNNWPVLRHMLRGNTVSDAPLIVASIDPCYSCTDRVTVVDVKKSTTKTVAYKEMERYCRERTSSPLK